MFGNFNFINTIKFNAYKIDKQLLMISYLLTLISTIFVYSATRSIKYIILNVMWIVVGITRPSGASAGLQDGA